MGKIVDASGLTYFGTKFRELLKTWTWLNNTFAKKSEMSVTDGSGADADKTTIQLKAGTSATVLKTHQDISGKVDKIPGKGLSTEDYTTEEKSKLGALPTNSELNTALAGKQDVISDLDTIRSGASAGATAYQKPVNGIPSTDMDSSVQTSLGKADAAAPQATTYTKTEVDNTISSITEKIPEQASSSNQLADKEFVNSSIETNTATFKGTYNLVTDLSLTTSATTAQIATALAGIVSGANNNDYVFVQIPTADATPTEIARVDRYKFNGTSWAYEWSLNNSSFTAAQWEAINSGITSGLVTKLSALPTNSELTNLLNNKVDKVTGKGLSTEDYTTSEKTKLSGIASGAQVNVLEGVQVDGTDLTITNKKVNVVISGKADKVSGATNGNLAGLNASGNLVDTGIAKEDVAQKTGTYPLLTSGLSENLVDTKGTGTEQEFIFRTSAGTESITDEGTGVVQEVRGKSVVWNQIIYISSTSQTKTVNGITITDNRDGSYTINGTASAMVDTMIVESRARSNAGNYMYISTGGAELPVSSRIYTLNLTSSSSWIADVGGTREKAIFTNVANTAYVSQIKFYVEAGITINNVTIRPMICDLTLMFGSGHEPTTVAEFEAMFPKPYYPYATPRTVNVAFDAIETNGFNQWDEEWEEGTLLNGQPVEYTGCIRSKNFIPVFDEEYYCAKDLFVACYDDSDGYIGDVRTYSTRFRPLTGTRKIKFRTQTSYGGTYNHDICINISHSGYRNGEYEAYWKQVRNIPITTATSNGTVIFPEGLKGVGTVYDSLFKDRATKRLGIVDLGSLTWYNHSSGVFYADITGLKQTSTVSLLCDIYTIVPAKYNSQWSNMENMSLAKSADNSGANSRVVVKNTNYTTNTNTFKTAMSGVYLIYELATPVTYTLDEEWNNTYKVADFGTEAITPTEDASGNPTTLPIDAIIKYNIDFTREVANLPENYVSATKSQSFTSDEKAQARTNIGAGTSDFSGSYNDLTEKPDLDAKADVDSICDELISGDVLAPYPLDRELTFDQTAAGADVGRKKARITGIKGKTLVWNQRLNYPDASVEPGFTVTKSDGNLYTITISENQSSAVNIANLGRPFAVGHVNFIKIVSSDNNIGIRIPSSGDKYSSLMMVISSNDLLYFRCKAGTPAGTYTIRVFIIDLTLMFGSGDEPSTVADFEKWYNKLYYSYNAGSLINNNATGLETVGFNVWDEEMLFETGLRPDGIATPVSGYETTSFIRVISGSTYYFKSSQRASYCCFYDNDKNYVSNISEIVKNTTFTIPAGISYMRLQFTGYGNVYNHDICINLSSSSRNGQYEPYWHSVLNLGLNSIACHDQNNNAVTVTGLDGVGSVYDEGVVENGMLTKIIKRFGEVDLGDLNWSYDAGNTRFFSNISNKANGYNNLVSSKYSIPSSSQAAAFGDKQIKGVTDNNNVYVKDSSITATTPSDIATALSGVYLVYELATPLTLTLDTPIPVDYLAGYTEKRLPEDTASVVSAPMKMSVRYSANAGPILQKIQTTFNNLLNAFKTAGKIASFTNSFDDGEGKFTIS